MVEFLGGELELFGRLRDDGEVISEALEEVVLVGGCCGVSCIWAGFGERLEADLHCEEEEEWAEGVAL